jgi:uncharacterized membrane-anchored protein
MQQIHAPLLGSRYWSALCLASIFGANMGDFFAHDIGLGHVAGLPYLAGGLVIILVAEPFDRAVHETYYWLAIVVVRTAATNLADFFSVDMRLPKLWVMAGLALLLTLTVAAVSRLVRRDPLNSNAPSKLLRADASYWLAMLIAGTLGTVMGDFCSHDLHLGNAVGSVVLSALLAPFFVLGVRGRLWSLSLYWTTVVMIRAAGTVVGDLLAGRHALDLPLSTAVSGLALITLLFFWRDAKGGSAQILKDQYRNTK